MSAGEEQNVAGSHPLRRRIALPTGLAFLGRRGVGKMEQTGLGAGVGVDL